MEDQGEKQIKALKEHGKQLVKYNNEEESSTYSKGKEIFEEIAHRRMEEIQDLGKEIDFNNLIYHYKSKNVQKSSIF